MTAAAAGLAPAQPEVAAQVQLTGHPCQAALAHQLRPQPGQVSLGQGGEAVEQVVRHHHAQHGVTQKLQTLVGAGGTHVVLIGIGAVGQRVFQKPGVPELIPQLLFQWFHIQSFFKVGMVSISLDTGLLGARVM